MGKVFAERFGGLDVGVNNAGVFQPLGQIHEQEDETFQKVMNVNLRGVWLCMKHQIRQMLKAGRGAIVNTTSSASLFLASDEAAYVTGQTIAADGGPMSHMPYHAQVRTVSPMT